VALLVLASFGIGSPAARGDMCMEGRRYFPYQGAVVSPDAQLWFFGEIGSGLPQLRREDGSPIRLVASERREVNHEWWGRRLVQRHAPVQPLEPGVYWLSFQSSISGRPDIVRRPIETSFTVDAGTHSSVPMPELRGVRWAGTLAVFELWLSQGMLVADFGDADEEPLESLQLEGPRDGLHVFKLGSSVCGSNLQVTDCLRTRVRFGALSAAASFSGWTAWQEVQFPGTSCAAPVVTPGRAPSTTSLWLPGIVAATALAVIALQHFRRRSR
jgi:hypothetical protein